MVNFPSLLYAWISMVTTNSCENLPSMLLSPIPNPIT